MAITHVKIHPAVGIARVGNSPDEWFVGPERRFEKIAPPGGFKDAYCRVKRQAVRFRLFAYHDDGPPTLLTSADGEIHWTVHLANTKVSGHALDPGVRSLSPAHPEAKMETTLTISSGGSSQEFDVLLGEARMEGEGHLLVLGGPGKAFHRASSTHPPIGWFDDVGDGPVTASIALKGGSKLSAQNGAWVVVAPPKFAPNLESVITLYDYLYAFAVSNGWQVPAATPSYTQHIQPILRRARDTRWVTDIPSPAHQWADPVIDDVSRSQIFARLRPPTGDAGPAQDMPLLVGEPSLTAVQYEWMQRWKDNDFVNDWSGPPDPAPEITPEDLDRAALDACVGPSFQPGIEIGGTVMQVLQGSLFVGPSDPLRIHPSTPPGRLTDGLNVTWHTDLLNCGGYWPIAKPTSVFPQGSTMREVWERGADSFLEFSENWPTLGFIVEEPDTGRYVEVGRCPEIMQPLDAERWRTFARILFGVTQDGGGWVIVNGVPHPVGPWDPLRSLGPRGGDAVLGLLMAELASKFDDEAIRAKLRMSGLDAARDAIVAMMRETRGRSG